MRAVPDEVPPIADSPIALRSLSVAQGDAVPVGDEARDSLLYVAAGSGRLRLGSDEHELRADHAALVLAGEEAHVDTETELSLVVAPVGGEVDLHAPMGPRETVVVLERSDAERASGSRAFQILFGPHNGSTRATFFAGFIPPGRAPWHYHLYDEIVWVPDGPGRLHLDDETSELGSGAAFRLRPRQVHIVENLSPDTEMTIVGLFTPAGSPSAAYLTAEIAAEYRYVPST